MGVVTPITRHLRRRSGGLSVHCRSSLADLRRQGATRSHQARAINASRLFAVLVLLTFALVSATISPSPAFAAPPPATPPGQVAAMAGAGGSDPLPIRQATPDLTAVKSNNVSGTVAAGTA